jgi:hypothetical protein
LHHTPLKVTYPQKTRIPTGFFYYYKSMPYAPLAQRIRFPPQVVQQAPGCGYLVDMFLAKCAANAVARSLPAPARRARRGGSQGQGKQKILPPAL